MAVPTPGSRAVPTRAADGRQRDLGDVLQDSADGLADAGVEELSGALDQVAEEAVELGLARDREQLGR